jgi:DNA-directed RNA polymerase II subunit RPB1
MTSTQGMVSIFRSGILNDDIGPIAKSTFEVHTEVILGASRHAEFDDMRGVSASVMMGQHGLFGTGCFNIVLDMEKFANMDDNAVDMTVKNKEIDRLFGGITDQTDSCAKNKIEIRNNMSAIQVREADNCGDDDYDIGF